jgi:CheY-like chemotaxis protein
MAKGRVLIVDDHELDRKLSTLDLEDAGYWVSQAGDVTEALELMGQRPFDCIVLDIVMPGTDGLTFLRGLRMSDRFSEIPVVMLTAKDELDDELQAMAGGAVSYIVKPSHRERLVQAVTDALETAKHQ